MIGPASGISRSPGSPVEGEVRGSRRSRRPVLCSGWPEEKLREAECIAIYRDPADLLRDFDQSPLARH